MSFTQVTVHGSRTNPDDSPAAGRIVFTPSAAMRTTVGATETRRVDYYLADDELQL